MFSIRNRKWSNLVLFLAPLALACDNGDQPSPRGGNHDGDGDDGGQHADDVQDGYTLELVVDGLSFPTAIAIAQGGDDDGRMFVSEAGIGGPARIVEITPSGGEATVTPILTTDDRPDHAFTGPFTDLTYQDGLLWVAHHELGENGWMVSAISVFDPDAASTTFRTVLTNLPGAGDHGIGDIELGGDGMLYLSMGTATNTGVVGPDNHFTTRWLMDAPDFHDFPAMDVALSGIEYETDNPLTTTTDRDKATTAPYRAFDSGAVAEGFMVSAPTVDSPIEGMIAGNGAIYRLDLGDFDPSDPSAEMPDTSLELVAWGLRNPYGMAFDPAGSGNLYVTNNGTDLRGAVGQLRQTDRRPDPIFDVFEPRAIGGDADDLFLLEPMTSGHALFYGFPDWFHDADSGQPLPVTDPMFCDAGGIDTIVCPQFALDQATRDALEVEDAVAQLERYSASNKLDISESETFGNMGDLFVAQTGNVVPTGGDYEFVGYGIVRVDGETYEVSDFIGAGTTQEDIFAEGQLNKPIDVEFDGDSMLVVDFGVYEPRIGLFTPESGKVWIVTAEETGMGGADAGAPTPTPVPY